MFWRFNYHSSEIDTLLDKEDVTLVEIISEEDVLQECKAQNTKLIDFLTKPENMKNLLSMVINEPSKEIEEKLRYKLPNSSCELLTSDITAITDSLMSTEALLNELLGFLNQEEALNPLQASFFSKIMGLLIMRKSQEFLMFLKSRSAFMDRLLHHLNTSAIMDLLLRLVISMDSPQSRTECLEWLKEQKLVERLIDLIRPVHSPETNYNASFSLCDLIRHGRDQLSFEQDTSVGDVLLKVIQSEESIKSLLNSMFEDPTVESSIIGGLSVLHTLLEFKKANLESPFESSTSSLPDVDKFMASIDGTLKALLPRLKDFHRILTHPPKQHYCPMQTTAGLLDVPLGNARLNVVRLITYLMVLNYKPLNEELIRLGTMGVLLGMFFEYSWNNFLHTQFEHIINNLLTNAITSIGSGSISLGASTSTSPAITVTTTTSAAATAAAATAAESNANSNASCCIVAADSATALINQLMVEFKLLNRIVEAFELNDDRMKVPSHRLGYIGHLTKISNSLLNSCNAPLLDSILLKLDQSDAERWKEFTTTALAEVNKQNSLDGTVGSASSVMSAVDDDFRMDFQIDSEHKFACTEDEGLDFEAALSDSNNWTNLSPTSLANSQKKASLFEEMCESRAEDFNDDAVVVADDVDDADEVTASAASAASDSSQSDEDIWKEKLANFPESLLKPEVSKSVKTHTPTERKKVSDDDEDDDDDDDDRSDEDGDTGPGSSCDKKSKNDEDDAEEMDVSSNDCWANFEEGQLGESTTPVAGRSPWSSNPPSVVYDDSNNAMTGWADFETAQYTSSTATNSTSNEGLTNINSINVFASIVKESGTDSLDKANQASAVDPPSFSNGPA